MIRSLAVVSLAALCLSACGEDPVFTRCVQEKKTYCNRLFACVKLGTLVGVQVNYEDESACETEETKSCSNVSEANACPGQTNSTYSSAQHDRCIEDQNTQSCSAFASRPSSCSTYCCTSQNSSC